MPVSVAFLAGVGWLNKLPFWLPLLRRKHIQSSNISPPISTAATIEPITMPAMTPPDSPLWDAPAAVPAAAVLDAALEDDDVGDEVTELVAKVIVAVIVGSTTPAHLFSAPEL